MNSQSLQQAVIEEVDRADNEDWRSKDLSANPPKAYNMKHGHRGYALIFNNKHFAYSLLQAGTTRDGTEADVKALVTRFVSLGFSVIVHDNLTAAGMETKLLEYAQKDTNNNASCFLAVFLTHGYEQRGGRMVLRGSDEKDFDLAKAVFQKREKSSWPFIKLVGKPKIFLVQVRISFNTWSWHGVLFSVILPLSIPSNRTVGSSRKTLISVSCFSMRQACRGDLKGDEYFGNAKYKEIADPQRHICATADVIFVFPSTSGYESTRHQEFGTVFIQSLCEALQWYANHPHMDFVRILTMVAYDVAGQDRKEGNMNNRAVCQAPTIESSLRKLLFLTSAPGGTSRRF